VQSLFASVVQIELLNSQYRFSGQYIFMHDRFDGFAIRYGFESIHSGEGLS
jgi:hypothetical protein